MESYCNTPTTKQSEEFVEPPYFWSSDDLQHWLSHLPIPEEVVGMIGASQITGEQAVNASPQQLMTNYQQAPMKAKEIILGCFILLKQKHEDSAQIQILELQKIDATNLIREHGTNDFTQCLKEYLKELDKQQQEISNKESAMELALKATNDEYETQKILQAEVKFQKDLIFQQDILLMNKLKKAKAGDHERLIQNHIAELRQFKQYVPISKERITSSSNTVAPSKMIARSSNESQKARAKAHGQKEEKKGSQANFFECAICQEYREVRATYPCGHKVCKHCLRQYLRMAMNDRSLWPLTCCKTAIDPEVARSAFRKEELAKFMKKREEYQCQSFMYCQNKYCSEFINLEKSSLYLSKVACAKCSTFNCKKCKQVWHEGPCKQKELKQEIKQLLVDQKWQRCSQCGFIIELNFGCFHMSCNCGHQFCYKCGVTWKNCKCERWQEDQLLAEQARRRQNQEQVLGRTMNRTEIVQLQANVRQQCTIHSFGLFQGGWNSYAVNQRCSNCSFLMKHFCYQCRNCQMRICANCHNHRRNLLA